MTGSDHGLARGWIGKNKQTEGSVRSERLSTRQNEEKQQHGGISDLSVDLSFHSVLRKKTLIHTT